MVVRHTVGCIRERSGSRSQSFAQTGPGNIMTASESAPLDPGRRDLGHVSTPTGKRWEVQRELHRHPESKAKHIRPGHWRLEHVANNRDALAREVTFAVRQFLSKRVGIKQRLCRMFRGAVASVDDTAMIQPEFASRCGAPLEPCRTTTASAPIASSVSAVSLRLSPLGDTSILWHRS